MAKTGESLCITRLSEILELPEETIYMAMEAMQNVESINAKVDSEGKEIVDLVSTGIDEQAKIVDKITILDMIKKLNSRDRQIINLRYFKDKTQTHI